MHYLDIAAYLCFWILWYCNSLGNKTKRTTHLTAEVLAKAGEPLRVKTQHRKDLEKSFHLGKVHRCNRFIQLISDDDLQFLLCLLKHHQTGIHSAACAADIMASNHNYKPNLDIYYTDIWTS